jgi:hypothetical protein
MDDFETKVPEDVFAVLDVNGNIPQETKELVKSRLRWLTFSDTVFVAMPYNLSQHSVTLQLNLIFFTSLVTHINRQMFEIGLPVRGAVHIGDVLVSKRCFAGKAIMDAHRLGEKCQVAATVFSDQAHAFISNVVPGFVDPPLIVESDVPTDTKELSKLLVDNSSEKMKTLCWFYLEMGRMEPFSIPPDLNCFIAEKFTAHGKTLSGEREKMKAVNTEKLFRDWQAASHSQYGQYVDMSPSSTRPSPPEQENPSPSP